MPRKPIIITLLGSCLVAAWLMQQGRLRPGMPTFVQASSPALTQASKSAPVGPPEEISRPGQSPASSVSVSADTLPHPATASGFAMPGGPGSVSTTTLPRFVHISNDRVASLLRIIDTPPVPFNRGWYVQVDTALIELLQYNDTFDIPTYLHSIVTDSSRDPVVRVYALQYAAEWLDKAAMGISDIHEAPRSVAQVIDLLWTETDDYYTTSLPGTALLNLSRLASGIPAIDKTRLFNAALTLAQNPVASIADRSTAISVCGDHHIPGTIALLISVAQDPSTPHFIRLAAIGKLGVFPDALASTALENFAAGQDAALADVCKKALLRKKLVPKNEVMNEVKQ